MGCLRPNVRLPSSSNSPQNSPENQGLPLHHSDSDHFPAPSWPLLLQLSLRPPIPLTNVRICCGYGGRSANDKGIQSQDLSYITMAEYLVHLFTQNKQVNTIKVHRASIASFLKTLNLPTKLQEDAIHIVIRRMSILRPRTQEVLQRWHLSVVLKGLMKPPFAINGLDRDLPLELQSYKTAFLIALATGAWGSELVTLSCALDNMDFKILDSGANHVSIGMAPKFIPTNQRPEIIPKPLEFPGIRHGSLDLERLLCPVRVLGLYQIRSADRAKEDPQQKLFVHYSPDPGSSLPTSDVG